MGKKQRFSGFSLRKLCWSPCINFCPFLGCFPKSDVTRQDRNLNCYSSACMYVRVRIPKVDYRMCLKVVSGLLNAYIYFWSKSPEDEALPLTIWKHFHSIKSILNDNFSSF